MSVSVGDVGRLGASRLVEALIAAAAGEDRVVLGLSGGTSPTAVLRHLPELLPPAVVTRLVLTWTDERVVPYAGHWTSWSVDINRRAAHEHWLQHLSERPRELPLWSGAGEPQRGMVDFEEAWRALGSRIDVLLLGFGPDGHLASLFPDHPLLESEETLVLVTDAPKPPPVRVSMSLTTLSRAGRVIGLATGAEKGAILRRSLAGDVRLPLGRYAPRAVEWVVDPPAAMALEST